MLLVLSIRMPFEMGGVETLDGLDVCPSGLPGANEQFLVIMRSYTEQSLLFDLAMSQLVWICSFVLR